MQHLKNTLHSFVRTKGELADRLSLVGVTVSFTLGETACALHHTHPLHPGQCHSQLKAGSLIFKSVIALLQRDQFVTNESVFLCLQRQDAEIRSNSLVRDLSFLGHFSNILLFEKKLFIRAE